MKTLTKKSLIIRELIITIVTLAAYFIVFSFMDGWNSSGHFDAFITAALFAFVVGLAAIIFHVAAFAPITIAIIATGVSFVITATFEIFSTITLVNIGVVFASITIIAAFFLVVFAASVLFSVIKKITLQEKRVSNKFVILSLIAEFLLITAGMFSVYIF